MAFLDNSGDIILDAVLTDAGRQRMAKGNFKIVKYAFGDDEINYAQFNSNHPSGSAFHDLEIMQTPILEALTNNTSMMNSKLFTMSRSNILYLPVMRLNGLWHPGTVAGIYHTQVALGDNAGVFVVTTSKATENAFVTPANAVASSWNNREAQPPGVMYGGHHASNTTNYICVDQGIISDGNPSIQQDLPSDLLETQFIVQMDHRLGRISSTKGSRLFTEHGNTTTVLSANTQVQPYSFVDDDNIASYYFGLGSDNQMITRLQREGTIGSDVYETWKSRMAFAGPVGTSLRFSIQSSLNLQESAAMFTELGGSGTVKVSQTSGLTLKGDNITDSTFNYIDTLVRVIGVTTGYKLDIPVRFIRLSS